MVASVFHEEDFLKHFMLKFKLGKQYIIPITIQHIMKPIIMAIKLLCENSPDQMKTQVQSLVASQKPASLRKLGFEFTKKQFQ